MDYKVDRGVDPRRPPATGPVDPWTLLTSSVPYACAHACVPVNAPAPDAVRRCRSTTGNLFRPCGASRQRGGAGSYVRVTGLVPIAMADLEGLALAPSSPADSLMPLPSSSRVWYTFT